MVLLCPNFLKTRRFYIKRINTLLYILIFFFFVEASANNNAVDSLDSFYNSINSIRETQNHRRNIGTKDETVTKVIRDNKRDYTLLKETIDDLNQFLFHNNILVEIRWCPSKYTGTLRQENGMNYICYSEEEYDFLLKRFPRFNSKIRNKRVDFPLKNEKNKSYRRMMIQWTISHEMGHYLQLLHYDIFGSHITMSLKYNSEKYLAQSDLRRRKMYKIFHVGTDNYAFALMKLLNWNIDDKLMSYLLDYMPTRDRIQNARKHILKLD